MIQRLVAAHYFIYTREKKDLAAAVARKFHLHCGRI
jgi:hypothetical protein